MEVRQQRKRPLEWGTYLWIHTLSERDQISQLRPHRYQRYVAQPIQNRESRARIIDHLIHPVHEIDEGGHYTQHQPSSQDTHLMRKKT